MYAKQNRRLMSIYSDKLAHVQVVINCQYSIPQLCTREDKLAQNLGALYFSEVMSYIAHNIKYKKPQ